MRRACSPLLRQLPLHVRQVWQALSLASGISLMFGCQKNDAQRPLVSIVDGDWQTNCLPHKAPFLSRRLSYSYSEAHLVQRREESFFDEACLEAAGTTSFRGTYELEVTRQPYIYQINLYYDDITAAALTASAADVYDRAQFCDITNWTIGSEEDITLRAGDGCPAYGIVPVKNWNLVQVKRAISLRFGVDIAHDNQRPQDVSDEDPTLLFGAQHVQ